MKQPPRTCLWRRFLRRDDGATHVEFVLMIPLILAIFLAGMEAGFMSLRQTMLERAVDMAMRDLRLGIMGMDPDHDDLKDAICENGGFLPDCDDYLKVSLEPVSMDNWSMPTDETVCRDRASDIDPVTALDPLPGAREELMLVRVCMRADALFPTTGIAANLDLDGDGGYRLIATSAFVNEP